MTGFFQAVAGCIIAVVLGLALSKQSKDIHILLGIGVCCMALVIAISYLQPVLSFVDRLQTLGDLDGNLVQILMKSVGIAIVAEIASLICADSGNGALGKTVQILATVLILSMSLPVMNALLELIQKIVGEI